MLNDERGTSSEYSLLFFVVILSLIAAIVDAVHTMRANGMWDVLWAWVGQNSWFFVGAVILGFGVVLGMLARGTGEDVVHLGRAGEWELSHHHRVGGDMDIRLGHMGEWQMAHNVGVKGNMVVRLRGEASPLAPWHIVGHCPRCGMPMFARAEKGARDEPPHVWRTCNCFTRQKQHRKRT